MTAQAIVYLLCFATSALCAWLLVRSYGRTRTALLLWSALSFVFLAVNNFMLVADVLLFPDINLILLRQLSALAAVGVLIYGFVWETE